MSKSVVAIVLVGLAVFVLVIAQVGAALLAGAGDSAGPGMSATSSFVQSRSSQPYLLRYVSVDPGEATEVFALEPGRRGGALGHLGVWAGTLEVLRSDCSVAGSIALEASAHSFVVVREDGRPERVPSTDVLDGPSGESVPAAAGRCQ